MSHSSKAAHAVTTAIVATLLLAAVPARAADHDNLDENLPLTIEDAYPIGYNGIEAQGFLRYDHNSRASKGSDTFQFAPRVEAGLLRNFQASVAVPYRLGDTADAKQGDVDVEGLYNFNNEGRVLPALSLGAGIDQPFGLENGGTETLLKFVSTKSIGSFGTSYVPRQLHVNAIWYHNYEPLSTERRNRYLIGLGYSQPVTNDLVALVDVYREQRRERATAENVAEAGGRYQLDPQTVLVGSVGAGFAARSPDVRVLLGFQHTLSWPYRSP